MFVSDWENDDRENMDIWEYWESITEEEYDRQILEEFERRGEEEQREREAEEIEAERMERENPMMYVSDFMKKFRFRNGRLLRHVHIKYTLRLVAFDSVNKKELVIDKTVHEIDTDDIEFAAAAADYPVLRSEFSSSARVSDYLSYIKEDGSYVDRFPYKDRFQVSPAYIRSLPKETNGYGELWVNPLDEATIHPSAQDFENELSQI